MRPILPIFAALAISMFPVYAAEPRTEVSIAISGIVERVKAETNSDRRIDIISSDLLNAIYDANIINLNRMSVNHRVDIDREAIVDMASLLEDEDIYVIAAASRALGQVGRSAALVGPQLYDAVNRVRAREYAMQLGVITGPPTSSGICRVMEGIPVVTPEWCAEW